jgi:hypothetical protein
MLANGLVIPRDDNEFTREVHHQLQGPKMNTQRKLFITRNTRKFGHADSMNLAVRRMPSKGVPAREGTSQLGGGGGGQAKVFQPAKRQRSSGAYEDVVQLSETKAGAYRILSMQKSKATVSMQKQQQRELLLMARGLPKCAIKTQLLEHQEFQEVDLKGLL